MVATPRFDREKLRADEHDRPVVLTADLQMTEAQPGGSEAQSAKEKEQEQEPVAAENP